MAPFLAMAELKRALFCSSGLTKTLDFILRFSSFVFILRFSLHSHIVCFSFSVPMFLPFCPIVARPILGFNADSLVTY